MELVRRSINCGLRGHICRRPLQLMTSRAASYGILRLIGPASNLSLSHYRAAPPPPPKPPGMGAKVFKREKPQCNIGTIGHVDHGKTTLTAAITKILAKKKLAKVKSYEDIDNAPEERKRGVTINASSVSYETYKKFFSHVDAPGHADYIKNFLVGVSQLDAAILVVAATEGPMPQTREHLILAKQTGIKKIIVYMNKADVADKETIELVELELRELLTELGFDGDNTPIIVGSALCALEDREPEMGEESINKLIEAMDTYIPLPERPLDKPFIMPVDHVHSIPGRGTVCTGKLEQGKIKKGSECEVLGLDKYVKTTITGIEMFHKSLDEAQAGDSLGVLLRGVKRDEVRRGMVVSQIGACKTADQFEAHIYLLKKEEGGRNKPLLSTMVTTMYLRTMDIAAQINMQGCEMMIGGEDSNVVMKTRKPIVADEGLNFTIRDGGKTLGSGVITKVLPLMTPEEKEKFSKGKSKEEKEQWKQKLLDLGLAEDPDFMGKPRKKSSASAEEPKKK